MKKFLIVVVMMVLLAVAVSADIRVTKASQDPDPVRAGDLVKLRLMVENTWADARYDVMVELLPSYPFSLYSSDQVKNLGRLEGGTIGADAVFADFWLRVDPNAVDGDNEFTVFVYDQDKSFRVEKKFMIDVESEKIAVKPYIVASDLLTPGRNGKFTIEIANAGANDIKALELELLPSDDYRLLSTSSYVYLGDLDIDDTESDDFSVYVPADTTRVAVPVRLSYRVNNQDYTEDKMLTLNLLSADEAEDLGLVQSSNTVGWVVLIAVIII